MKKEFKFRFVCDEDPFKMKETSNNSRHCDKCERNIVDFTKFTPQQITEYIKNNKKPCGFMRPWQIDEINEYLKQSKEKNSPFYKLMKVAAVAGSPLLFSPALAQKNIVPVEMNSTVRTEGRVVTIVVLKDKNDVPLDSVEVDIYEGAQLLSTKKTDMNGKITLNHEKYAGKELTLKNNALGIEKNITMKQEGVCLIWKTSYSKTDQPVIEDLTKFDVQFVYSDVHDKPIRNTNVTIQVYDTLNTMIEEIEISTNFGGYSYFKTRNLGRARYFYMQIDTKDGNKSAYLYVDNLKKNEVNQVPVNKKFKHMVMGFI